MLSERKRAFAGHSRRAGLASSAQVDEAHVQKHLGAFGSIRSASIVAILMGTLGMGPELVHIKGLVEDDTLAFTWRSADSQPTIERLPRE